MSLSSDGRILASGGPVDSLAEGATWIFVYDGSTYKQLGQKLVGTGNSGRSRQGKGGAHLHTGRLRGYQFTIPNFLIQAHP